MFTQSSRCLLITFVDKRKGARLERESPTFPSPTIQPRHPPPLFRNRYGIPRFKLKLPELHCQLPKHSSATLLTFKPFTMRRAFTRSFSAAAARTPRSSTTLRMPSAAQNSKIAARRLHATAQHLKPATATALRSDPTSHEKIQDVQDTPYFIDNKFVKSEASQFIELHDPATNNLVTRVPQSTDAELKAAVESATKAWPAWRDTSVMARQQIMFKFTQGVRDNWDRLAASITLEQGKTFAGMLVGCLANDYDLMDI